MRTSRRRFLTLAGSTAVVSLSGSIPLFLRRATASEAASDGDTVLVVVQLTGGNDGLNTVIPYGDDAYHRNRFSLDYDRDAVLKVDDYHGFHPSMRGMADLLEAGKLAVVQGVGYPNPNRSHFESMDIWHTASHELPAGPTGWLGRGLDEARGTGGDLPALHLGSEKQPLALASRHVPATSLQSIEGFRLETKNDGQLRDIIVAGAAASRELDHDLLEFIRANTVSAFAAAERVESLANSYQSRVVYPGTALATRLKSVAQLIAAGLNTRIYYVTLDGFDTHSNQRDAHAALLDELSGAAHAFLADLGHQGHADRVMLMTFSEFGRRVKENASGGTDHGAAAPMFLAGTKVRGGIIGQQPSLTDLDDGDVKFHTDFRRVYAGVLKEWLGWDSAAIVGKEFSPLAVVQS